MARLVLRDDEIIKLKTANQCPIKAFISHYNELHSNQSCFGSQLLNHSYDLSKKLASIFIHQIICSNHRINVV